MKHLFSFAGLLAVASIGVLAENWPQFRGPTGNGISQEKRLPLEWSESRNVTWKTAIHDKGWSSPVIWNGMIWLTTASDDGRKLSVLSLDAATGKVLRDIPLFEAVQPDLWKRYNSYASPTPVVARGRVYVSFGAAATACLSSPSGKVLWERRDIQCNHFRGAGSSPVLHGKLLFLNFDGSDHQFVVALDAATGKTVWSKDRSVDHRDIGPNGKPEADGDMRKAFATCQVATLGGMEQLISQGAKAVYGYEPRTGRELWRVEDRTSHSAGTRPVTGHGLVFVPSGWSQGQTLAIRPGTTGGFIDVNGTEASSDPKLGIAWKSKRGTPKKPSLTLVDGLLFGVEDGGVATCWEAKTGAVLWSERLGGNYSASPLAGAGRLYCVGQEGQTVVIAAERTFRKLAENRLDKGSMASPAASDGALFVRTETHLYRLDDRSR